MNISIQRCYDLLELPVGSSYEEVKNAYRMMTKVWHPDRFAADTELRHKAEEKLKLINVAFQILQADLQKTQEKLKQIDLVYEILQDHLESTPSVGSSAEANQSPELPGGKGSFEQGKKALKRIAITPRFAIFCAVVVVSILVIALSTPEEKTFIANPTPGTEINVAPRPSRVPLHEGAVNQLTKPQALTDEDKAYYLRLRGYDPEKFEVSDFGQVSPRAVPQRTPPADYRLILPKSVKFCVVAGDATHLSEQEPKPVENGYKVISYPGGNEVLVSGKVQIFHLND